MIKRSSYSYFQCEGFPDDNAAYRQTVDTQGNITEEPETTKEVVKGIQGVKEMMETGDTDSEMTTSEDRTEGRLHVKYGLPNLVMLFKYSRILTFKKSLNMDSYT